MVSQKRPATPEPKQRDLTPFVFQIAFQNSTRRSGWLRRTATIQIKVSPKLTETVQIMLQIDATIEAHVVRVEPYGLYLEYGDDTIFVTLDNLSWLAKPDSLSNVRAGQKIAIKILHYAKDRCLYVGSVKHLHPEENPYQHLARQPLDTVFRARVMMIHQHGVSVMLENNCIGDLPLNVETTSLPKGAEVDVQITALDADYARLSVKLAQTEPGRTGHETY